VDTAFDVLEPERVVNMLLHFPNDEVTATDGLCCVLNPRLLLSLTDPIQQAKCFHYTNYSSYSTEVTVVEAFGLLVRLCQADEQCRGRAILQACNLTSNWACLCGGICVQCPEC